MAYGLWFMGYDEGIKGIQGIKGREKGEMRGKRTEGEKRMKTEKII